MRQMMLTEILLNPSVPPDMEEVLTGQVWDVYRLFLNRKCVCHKRIAKIAAQYNARISEIRAALIPEGWIIGPPGKRGKLNFYKLIRLEEAPKKWLESLKVYWDSR